jgi:nicotinamide phosphoribosyltransferase
MKATWGVVDGQERELFKDPVTDNGTKKSAKGLLRVTYEDGNFKLYDQQTPDNEKLGLLQTVFEDGNLIKFQTWGEVKANLRIF